MKKITKILVLIMGIGLTMSVLAFIMGINYERLRVFFNEDHLYGERITYQQDFEITDLEIDAFNRNFVFVITEDPYMTITYYQKEIEDVNFTSDNQKLKMTQTIEQSISTWFNYKFVSKEIQIVTVYIPKAWSFNISLVTNRGNIDLRLNENIDMGQGIFETNVGNVYLGNVSFESIDIVLKTGNIGLKNVTANQMLLKTNTGKISINNSSGLNLLIQTIKGSIVIEDSIMDYIQASVDTGYIFVYQTTVLDELIINCSTGEVEIMDTIANQMTIHNMTGSVHFSIIDIIYAYELQTRTGNIMINGYDHGTWHQTTHGQNSIYVFVHTGDIIIKTHGIIMD